LVLLDPASEGELIVALDFASARALAEQMLARCDAVDGNRG